MSQRIEHDSMGPIPVANDKYWGAQTERSRCNFHIGNQKMPMELIRSLAIVKRCAAASNLELNLLKKEIAETIINVCDEIIIGQLDDHFPLSVWQTGSGTQSHMNVNEVIANRANEILGYPLGSKSPIHPNDHVNYGQSSNDSFPTAVNIAVALSIEQQLQPSLQNFLDELERKSEEFANDIKIGRTHLQDATPLTLGQEFSGYAQQIKNCTYRVDSALAEVLYLAQGGTAVGSGLNCPKGFAELFAKKVKDYTGLDFQTAPNKFCALASHEDLLSVSSALNSIAVAVFKIANDIRLLGSGPRCGLSELILPSNEPGSSIMPGKVNPTQAEALTMVCVFAMGLHNATSIACSQGHFELNVFKPLLAYNVLEQIVLISEALDSFRINCLVGINVNHEKLQENIDKSLMLVTALNPIIGYDNAAKVAKKAYTDNITLQQAAQDLGLLQPQEFQQYVDPKKMINF